MYDQWFSVRWWFDRCQEGSFFSFHIAIVFAIVIFCVTFIFLTRRKMLAEFPLLKQILRLALSLLSAVSGFFLGLFLIIIGGFFVINCSSYLAFSPAVESGNVIHAMLKNRSWKEGTPTSQEEVAQFQPAEYKALEQIAKIKYVYDPETKRYTLFVRPSRYKVIVYDSKTDYKIYLINRFPLYGTGKDIYPPEIDGPWDQLPE